MKIRSYLFVVTLTTLASGQTLADGSEQCAGDMRATTGAYGLMDREALQSRIAKLETKQNTFRHKAQRRQDRRHGGDRQELAALKTALVALSDRQLAAGCVEFIDAASLEARLLYIKNNMENR